MTNTPTSAPWPEAFGFLVASFEALALSTELQPTDRMLVDEAIAYIRKQDALRFAEQVCEPNPLLDQLTFVPTDDAQEFAQRQLDGMTMRTD